MLRDEREECKVPMHMENRCSWKHFIHLTKIEMLMHVGDTI